MAWILSLRNKKLAIGGESCHLLPENIGQKSYYYSV